MEFELRPEPEMFKMKRFTKNAESVLKDALNDEDELLSLCSYSYGVHRRDFRGSPVSRKPNPSSVNTSINQSALHSAGNHIISPQKGFRSGKASSMHKISEEDERFLQDYYRERSNEKQKQYYNRIGEGSPNTGSGGGSINRGMKERTDSESSLGRP